MGATLIRLCTERVSELLSTTLSDTIFSEMFFSLQGAEGDDDASGSGGSGSSGSSDEDDDADDDEDADDDDPEDEPLDGKSAKKLREEAAKRRRKNRELQGKVEQLEKERQAAANAGKSETERLKAELESANAKLEESQAKIQDGAIRTSFLENNKVTWHDPRTAMKLLDREDIEIEDDGSVSGMDAAIKALAEEHPYLVKKSKDDDTKGEKSKDKKGSSGEGGTRTKKSKDTVDREALARKYPALR